jgi:uncharacterized damage-inducible protein DinB
MQINSAWQQLNGRTLGEWRGMENIVEQMLEAWRTNNRINLFLIDRIDNTGMKCTLPKRGGRNVIRQFAHLHNVRVMHLENRAKTLAIGYFIAHESHHRGSILLTLKQCGHGPDQLVKYAIWDWEKM